MSIPGGSLGEIFGDIRPRVEANWEVIDALEICDVSQSLLPDFQIIAVESLEGSRDSLFVRIVLFLELRCAAEATVRLPSERVNCRRLAWA